MPRVEAVQGDPPAVSWLRSWGLLIFLTLLNVLNFVDRQLIASLAPLLIRDLHLTNAQIGLLAGFAFVFFYSVMGLVLGAAADRVSRPRLIAAGLALWSVMTAASGLARGFLHLAVPRMLVGVGEATLTPAALSMMADVLPRHRLALATGIYYAGIPLGMGISLFVAGWVAPRFGWRACFYLLGAIGVVFSVLLLAVGDPRRAGARGAEGAGAARSGTAPAAETAAALRDAVRAVPALGLTILGGALLCYGSASAIHAVSWLVRERGFEFQRAAFLAGGVAVVAGFLGNLAGGAFADACQRRWRAGRLWSLVILVAATTPVSLAFYLLPPATPAFMLCWLVASMAVTAYFGPLFAVVQELAPRHLRSTIVALALLGLNLLGVGPGPWITGMIGDASSLTRGLLVSLAVAALSIVPFAWAARRYEGDAAAAAALPAAVVA
jgi:MFS family permease